MCWVDFDRNYAKFARELNYFIEKMINTNDNKTVAARIKENIEIKFKHLKQENTQMTLQY